MSHDNEDLSAPVDTCLINNDGFRDDNTRRYTPSDSRAWMAWKRP